MVLVARSDFRAKNEASLTALERALREAEKLAQDPANFAAMFKIAEATFKINAPGGDKVLEVSLKNNLKSFKFDVEPKALQHIAEYMHRGGQIDKLVDTSRLLGR